MTTKTGSDSQDYTAADIEKDRDAADANLKRCTRRCTKWHTKCDDSRHTLARCRFMDDLIEGSKQLSECLAMSKSMVDILQKDIERLTARNHLAEKKWSEISEAHERTIEMYYERKDQRDELAKEVERLKEGDRYEVVLRNDQAAEPAGGE